MNIIVSANVSVGASVRTVNEYESEFEYERECNCKCECKSDVRV